MSARHQGGLTLVELLTVVAVLGVVLALAAPSFADLMNKHRVAMVATNLSSDLAYARSEGVLRARSVSLRFASNAQTSCYVVHVVGAVGICNCLNAEGSECPAPPANQIALKAVRVAAARGVSLVPAQGVPAITFTATQSMLSAASATVTVVGNRGYRLETRVNSVGRVLICDPNGSMGGNFKPCPDS